jgi:hypothetical protein
MQQRKIEHVSDAAKFTANQYNSTGRVVFLSPDWVSLPTKKKKNYQFSSAFCIASTLDALISERFKPLFIIFSFLIQFQCRCHREAVEVIIKVWVYSGFQIRVCSVRSNAAYIRNSVRLSAALKYAWATFIIRQVLSYVLLVVIFSFRSVSVTKCGSHGNAFGELIMLQHYSQHRLIIH